MTDNINQKHSQIAAPNFIGVGPEKTGTTWMFKQLQAHDAVRVPKLKELRYFWEDFYHHKENPILRLLNKQGWHRARYRQKLRVLLKNVITHPISAFGNLKELKQDISYIFRTHDDDWYINHFVREEGTISGEVSPQYFFLDPIQIQRIGKLFPDCKIIVTLRDPVEWIRSFANMLKHNEGFGKMYKDMDDFIEKKRAESSFSNAFRNWIEVFGKDNVGVFFYDDLLENPWNFYTDICQFLEIEPDNTRRSSVDKRVNAAKLTKTLDAERARKIRQLWQGDMLELQTLIGALPPSWMSE